LLNFCGELFTLRSSQQQESNEACQANFGRRHSSESAHLVVIEKREARLAALLKKAQRGDDTSLSLLCQQLETDIRSYFRQKFSDGDVVNDLCQETYVRLLNSLPQIREEMKLVSYVTRVAFHVMQDYLRDKYTGAAEIHGEGHGIGDNGPIRTGSHATGQDERLLDNIDLRAALRQLPEKSRAILMMKYQGYTYPEIAEDMRMSVSGVKMQIMRSLEQLKFSLFFVTFLVFSTTILMRHINDWLQY